MSQNATFRLQLLLQPEDRRACGVQSAGCEKRADYMLRIGVRRLALCGDHLQALMATLRSPAETMGPES